MADDDQNYLFRDLSQDVHTLKSKLMIKQPFIIKDIIKVFNEIESDSQILKSEIFELLIFYLLRGKTYENPDINIKALKSSVQLLKKKYKIENNSEKDSNSNVTFSRIARMFPHFISEIMISRSWIPARLPISSLTKYGLEKCSRGIFTLEIFSIFPQTKFTSDIAMIYIKCFLMYQALDADLRSKFNYQQKNIGEKFEYNLKRAKHIYDFECLSEEDKIIEFNKIENDSIFENYKIPAGFLHEYYHMSKKTLETVVESLFHFID